MSSLSCRFLLAVLTFGAAMGVATLSSCSSSDEENSEYANWGARNSQYFETAYQEALAKSQSDPTHWQVKKAYSKDKAEGAHTDYIIMQWVENGGKTVSPYYNDYAVVHYRGCLIPTPENTNTLLGMRVGKVFDSSWYGNEFDPSTASAKGFRVNNELVQGFTTALMNMHPGDRCLVTIPYQLGYGSSEQSSVPQYSVLIFDIKLQSFSR